jgi:hypothetical protein
MNDTSKKRPVVVIIGGGFGGLWAAKSLAKLPVDVTLIDRKNHHVFQPLLYQVATAVLSPGEIAQPIRRILHRNKNTEVILGEAVGFDLEERQVLLSDGARVPFDYLIVSAGARHAYFGNDDWESAAPGLKTLEDAVEIRRRVLLAFEMAERDAYLTGEQRTLTFVVVGGGPTGVELAGAIADIARKALAKDFKAIDTAKARVILFEGSDRVLGTFAGDLSESGKAQLEDLGVEVQAEQFCDRDRVGPGQGRRRMDRLRRGALGDRRRGLAARQGSRRGDRQGRTRIDRARPVDTGLSKRVCDRRYGLAAAGKRRPRSRRQSRRDADGRRGRREHRTRSAGRTAAGLSSTLTRGRWRRSAAVRRSPRSPG